MNRHCPSELIACLQTSFNGLGVTIAADELQRLAATILDAMNARGRVYHNLEHALSLWDGRNPIHGLAALFHDIVYLQLDGGLLPEIRAELETWLDQRDGEIRLQRGAAEVWPVGMCLEIFARDQAQPLTSGGGLNEFLSALFMIKKLDRLAPAAALVQLTTCIEATIPFRESAHFTALAERVRRATAQFQVDMDEAALDETIRLAVAFANADVANFADADAGVFLESTWKLLPEMNAVLRERSAYTIRDYRAALQGTEAFFGRLKPERVIHRWRDWPAEEEYRALLERVRRNLETGREYVRVKLVAIALIEALAELSGGNTSLPLFMGDATDGEAEFERMAGLLPPHSGGLPDGHSTEVQRLFTDGRKSQGSFDARRSLLALFIYQRIGRAELEAALAAAQRMFAGEIAPAEYLAGLPGGLAAVAAGACAEMIPERRAALMRIAGGEYG